MTNADDEYAKQILAPLHPTPPLDPLIAAEEKAKFLLLGENMRQAFTTDGIEKRVKHGNFLAHLSRRQIPLFKGLVATLIALVILIGSSLTVYAAQGSLPGESLYSLKVIGEDIRLSLTRSPQARLDLTLDYTNRRVGEISTLSSGGEALPDQTTERLQSELEDALELAAQMDDHQMQNALGKIKNLAASQGMTLEELITKHPEQAAPAMIHLQERLREQVKLSTLGESDPQSFRKEIRARQGRNPGKHISTPASDDSRKTPAHGSTTPLPMQDSKDRDNGTKLPENKPGQGGNNPGQGNSIPGNGNHGKYPVNTPTP
ncbi:MAG: hypothetical protein A2030_02105 [Chloroflexi bacterium RBG_19FT_COMBO_50_10]|nr:MAG: hypothetical protein A2Y53_03555 [Chloroflexi bacterium RBG_16_47_49]OGO66201.1 MAG: hypothetical protein A2030_02105 [Chloroflexi bacterium RBG_19FT_COMBO_50_10]